MNGRRDDQSISLDPVTADMDRVAATYQGDSLCSVDTAAGTMTTTCVGTCKTDRVLVDRPPTTTP
jgi:hypothetical protein